MKTITEQKRLKANRAVAQAALIDHLEFDATGLLKHAGLTWDQYVQWSIAKSLKAISDRLEANADEGRR